MSTNPEKAELNGEMLITKFKINDKVFAMFNDRIVECEVLAVSKNKVATDDKGNPLISSNLQGIEETYTLKTPTGMWTRTNNVNDLYVSVEALKEDLKIIYL